MLVLWDGACAKKPTRPPEPRDAQAIGQAPPVKADTEPKDDGPCGYVDRTGKLIIPRRFDRAGEFSSGLAAIVRNLRTGFIDGKGNDVIPPRFDAAKDFREGLAAACVKGKGWGFVDPHGAWAIPPSFSFADSFAEGVAVVKTDPNLDDACADDALEGTPPGEECEKEIAGDDDGPGAYYLIDRTGQRLHGKGYHCITRVSDGMAAVLWKNRWGYLDRKGKEVIRPTFVRAKPFGEGWAAVWLPDRRTEDYGDGKWAFIDKQGKFKVLAKYDASEVGVFSQGLVAMEGIPIRALWGSPVGRACLAGRGYSVDDFRNNPDVDSECGAYMDKNGKVRIAVPYCGLDDVDAGERSLHEFHGSYAELVVQEPMTLHPFKCAPALMPFVRLFIDRQGDYVSPVAVLAGRSPEGLAPSCVRRDGQPTRGGVSRE
jgi:WG containing repeat